MTGLVVVLVVAIACETAQPTEPPGIGPQAGRPYTTADVMLVLEASLARPDAALEPVLVDERLAAGIAKGLYTFDGRRYADLRIVGACGQLGTCGVGVTGSRPGAAGEDISSWIFDLSSGELALDGWPGQGQRAYPASLDGVLDAVARRVAATHVRDLSLQGANWLPPPNDGEFIVVYNSADGQRPTYIHIDLDTERLISVGLPEWPSSP